MTVFLDACCLINLLATDRFREILTALPHRFATSRYVLETEVRSTGFPEHLDAAGVSVLELATDEGYEELVRFATVVDDGEASVCALAILHSGSVATDDRKVLRVLTERSRPIPILQTPDLLFQWAEQTGASENEIRRSLRAIRDQARFVPRKDAPHADWWWSFLR